MHRCIAILGPAIRVSYRDPSTAILNFFFFFFLNISHTGYVSRYHKRRIIVRHHMYRDTRADVISTADNVENRCKKTCSMYNI